MINGVLNVYKEKGFTSHDVVAKLRGILRQKKIGHTGTLDPDAEGVLPVCLGNGTKLCDMLTDRDKAYRTVLLLGQVTDTQDVSGTVLQSAEVMVTEAQVREAVMHFVGEYDQVPPMYSALKVNGKKLYELAREGKTVERAARRVQIHEIIIEEIDLPRVTMTVSCSKGTYIRTLCHDIGGRLGCGGCMEQLLRVKAGPFVLKDSLTLAQIEKLKSADKLNEAVIPVEVMFAEYPACSTKPQFDKMLYNGNPVFYNQLVNRTAGETVLRIGGILDGPRDLPIERTRQQVRVYDSKQKFCGLYEYRQDKNGFWPVKMFLE